MALQNPCVPSCAIVCPSARVSERVCLSALVPYPQAEDTGPLVFSLVVTVIVCHGTIAMGSCHNRGRLWSNSGKISQGLGSTMNYWGHGIYGKSLLEIC